MAYDYSELVEKTKSWAQQATAAGWLNPHDARQLCEMDTRTPETLFNGASGRPLVVAFMGGTGVGKSSLLNRLAGQAIAKAGVERPTSREVTLFRHKDIAIQHLPAKLPIEKIKIAQHDDDKKKNIIWIDMPDFDSTEQSNKLLVFEWLPHIDVLIYVVSPERYRDDKAWRLLLSEGSRHAWLFVLNQWDRGQQAQYEDFKLQLGKAGFAEPLIFKTVCSETTYPDEFAALEAMLLSLANQHVVAELEQRGTQIRKEELKKKLEAASEHLGVSAAFGSVNLKWAQHWEDTVEHLHQGLVWPLQRLAKYYAENAANLIGQPSHTGAADADISNALWDHWAQARFEDALDDLVIKADESGLPVAPIKNQLAAVKPKAGKIIHSQTELQVRQALANPGNLLHRAFLKFIRFCEIFLPLAAACWVGYQVFIGFYASNTQHQAYLGADFAIHSTLLILLSWLIPWFILKKLKPSLEKSALNGLRKGMDAAFVLLDQEVQTALEAVADQHQAQQKQAYQLIEQCASDESGKPAAANEDTALARMLIH